MIIAATFLLIYHAPDAIQCARIILDYIMLAQYIPHDDETLRYMEHTLYRLRNTKMVFEYNWSIHIKLCQPIFSYSKFNAICHFIHCNQDYVSIVNDNTAHGETDYKYLLKAFHNRINDKNHDSQIRQQNVRYINIIVMKDVIIFGKTREEKILLVRIADMTAPVKVAQVLGLVDLAWRYNWAMSNADLNISKQLELTDINKYWRRAG